MGLLIKFQTKLVSRLRELRDEKDIQQLDLAKKVGISRAHLSYIERDRSDPTVKIAAKLAAALDVTLDQLVNEKDSQ